MNFNQNLQVINAATFQICNSFKRHKKHIFVTQPGYLTLAFSQLGGDEAKIPPTSFNLKDF